MKRLFFLLCEDTKFYKHFVKLKICFLDDIHFGLLEVDIVNKFQHNYYVMLGGSPGLVVMGRNSRSEGCGFKSQHHKLDGQFFTYICCKNCYDVCLKRPKINEKEAGFGPFFLKKNNSMGTSSFTSFFFLLAHRRGLVFLQTSEPKLAPSLAVLL